MAAGFNSTTLSLGQLLSDPNLLRVPDFQRPYSWTISEAEHLLDDIIVSISDPHDGGQREGYFLGLVLLLKGADAPEPKQSRQFLDIIDGQQRLATATIILASIRTSRAIGTWGWRRASATTSGASRKARRANPA